MPKLFSIRPALKFRGRQFKGLRGFAGKPFHPPLTDIPVACYVLVAVFDLVSFVVDATDGSASIARDFYISGTHVIIAGLIVSVPTALTGFWDWLRSTTKGTQARRTANWHMTVMFTVTGIVILDVILRLAYWEEAYAELPVVVLSVIAGALVSYGAVYGGTLVYDYGFNVETSGDHPVWHESEQDVLPGSEAHP